jgi:hypothetical protein
MTRPQEKPDASNDRTLLVALAVCCAVPMLAIIVLTSIIGIALGAAVAVSLGLVAAMVCVAVMVQHHRGGEHHNEDHRDWRTGPDGSGEKP